MTERKFRHAVTTLKGMCKEHALTNALHEAIDEWIQKHQKVKKYEQA
jgi:hypothetical protein